MPATSLFTAPRLAGRPERQSGHLDSDVGRRQRPGVEVDHHVRHHIREKLVQLPVLHHHAAALRMPRGAPRLGRLAQRRVQPRDAA
ncbi:MAG: hypothetical protein L0K56_08065 [Corynebacterium sp.]|nr:hypothetical protein [Corynebacterium sp.]